LRCQRLLFGGHLPLGKAGKAEIGTDWRMPGGFSMAEAVLCECPEPAATALKKAAT